jgi:predicted permease
MTGPPWWIRAACRLLPHGFRERFGPDVADAAASLAGDARRAGGRARQLRYIVRELVALSRLAVSLRKPARHILTTHHAASGAAMSANVLDELRWALRYARRRPVFAGVVIATLAAAIAAATAAAGLANAVLWRALPFDDASRLVFVWEEVERDGQRHPSRVTGARHAAWRDTPNGLASLSLFGAAGFTFESEAGATSIRGVRVSANYFDTLGIRAALGRTFVGGDEVPGDHRVVILSHALWQERYGGRRDAIGETLRLSGHAHTVVGVMPPVTFPAWPVNPAIVTLDADSRQLWVPIPRTPEQDHSGRAHVFGVVARLAPGVTPGEVVDRLNATSDATGADPHRARLTPLREQLVADARTPLLALAGATLALLLIACANLAALYVSAFESRRAELTVRAAIGAGVPRLVRQLALESLLLASAGAIAGVLIARVALAVAPGALPASIPFLTVPSLDLRLTAFAFGLALVATVLVAGWPIARLIMAAPAPRGVAPPARQAVYRVLVVSQVAITMALAAAAGLLAQSLTSVRRQHPGFSADRVFVADLGLPSLPHGSAAGIAAAERNVLSALATLSNALAVAAAYDHPLEANWSESPTVVGESAGEDQRRPAELRIVSPGYFEALDVVLLDGRTLTERDALGAPGVAIVNEAFAREMGGRALGRRILSGTPRFLHGDAAPHDFEIVGVVGNERFRGLERPAQSAFYLSTRQFPQTSFSILVRTAGDPLAMTPDVRAALRAADRGITLNHATSLEQILAEQLDPRRMTTELIGGFAAAAVALAALGMYGLLAALVGSRTREIGVRLAIGASPASVAKRIVVDSLRNAVVGVVVGCAMALIAGRLIQSLLVGVSASDPITLATAAAVLLTVAAFAAIVPARRAARVDPAISLRAE